jgi:hypothetical protein
MRREGFAHYGIHFVCNNNALGQQTDFDIQKYKQNTGCEVVWQATQRWINALHDAQPLPMSGELQLHLIEVCIRLLSYWKDLDIPF